MSAMQVSALSVKKLQKPGYKNKSSWPWTPSQEDKHLRLECQQCHVERLEREVEATGKRKKGGTSEWVSYPEVSVQQEPPIETSVHSIFSSLALSLDLPVCILSSIPHSNLQAIKQYHGMIL